MRVPHVLTTDQSDAGSARVYSHDGPIRRSKRGYILTTDQSDAGSVGMFSRRINQTQEARVYTPLLQHTHPTVPAL
eukprot:1179698-Prorocentrum_minimum.AAC.1